MDFCKPITDKIMGAQLEPVALMGATMVEWVNGTGGTKNGCRVTTLHPANVKGLGVKVGESGVYDITTFGAKFRVYYAYSPRSLINNVHTVYPIGVYDKDGNLDIGLFTTEKDVRLEIFNRIEGQYKSHVRGLI